MDFTKEELDHHRESSPELYKNSKDITAIIWPLMVITITLGILSILYFVNN